MNDLNINHSYITRDGKYDHIINKFPNKIPVLVRDSNSKTQLKLLVPKNMFISQIIYIIRKKIKLNEHEAIYILVNNKMPPGTSRINEIYNTHRDSDGLLYITYTKENTFG